MENPAKALKELKEAVGFEVRAYVEGTVAVPERLELNMKKLRSYLNWALKLHSKGRIRIWKLHDMLLNYFMSKGRKGKKRRHFTYLLTCIGCSIQLRCLDRVYSVQG